MLYRLLAGFMSTKARLDTALDRYLIADWRRAHRFWSNRIAVFWALFSVLWLLMPALEEIVAPQDFVIFSAFMSLVFVWARITRQKGMVDG